MRVKHHAFKLMSLWPPLLGAGIRVRHVSPDIRRVEVEMRLRPWTRNYVGTHYGGSLYSLTDPWFMLMLIENLGRDYIVWDKAAFIRFKKPGKGLVKAVFTLPEETLESLKEQLRHQPKVEPVFHVDVVNSAGEVVAAVEKTLHIRLKAGGAKRVNSEEKGS